MNIDGIADRGLDGKVAIVTGAGSRGTGIGIGRASAVLLAEAGVRVAILDRDEENLEGTRTLIEARGGECIARVCEVTDPGACEAAVSATVESWGGLDVLVNNVGVLGPAGTVVDLDLDEWELCVRINVSSMILMSRYSIPQMRDGGVVINMSSIASLVGGTPVVAYGTTKGAINSLTKTMAAQHGPDGIRVNAIAPGYVYTPMVTATGMSEEMREKRRLAAPLRTEGTAWDVAQAVAYLASDQARWVSGAIFTVDAGLTADGTGMTAELPRDS